MTQLMEKPVETTPPMQVMPRRSRWMVPIAVLVALLLGGLSGWLLANAADEDSKPTTVVAGNVALTDRQQEMIRITDEYTKAWQANDVNAVLAFYTSTGTFRAVPGGPTYRVDDGSLEAFVRSGDWSTLTAIGPTMVVGGEVVLVTRTAGVGPWMNVLDFTQYIGAAPLILNHLSISP